MMNPMHNSDNNQNSNKSIYDKYYDKINSLSTINETDKKTLNELIKKSNKFALIELWKNFVELCDDINHANFLNKLGTIQYNIDVINNKLKTQEEQLQNNFNLEEEKRKNNEEEIKKWEDKNKDKELVNSIYSNNQDENENENKNTNFQNITEEQINNYDEKWDEIMKIISGGSVTQTIDKLKTDMNQHNEENITFYNNLNALLNDMTTKVKKILTTVAQIFNLLRRLNKDITFWSVPGSPPDVPTSPGGPDSPDERIKALLRIIQQNITEFQNIKDIFNKIKESDKLGQDSINKTASDLDNVIDKIETLINAQNVIIGIFVITYTTSSQNPLPKKILVTYNQLRHFFSQDLNKSIEDASGAPFFDTFNKSYEQTEDFYNKMSTYINTNSNKIYSSMESTFSRGGYKKTKKNKKRKKQKKTKRLSKRKRRLSKRRKGKAFRSKKA